MARKEKDSMEPQESKLRPLWMNIPLIIIIFGAAVILFFQDNNIFVIRQYDNEIEELRQEIKAVDDSTSYYRNKILELNTSREELERISREQYKMKKRTEDVFITNIE